ncbi:beta-propeller domain-containing protein [Stigmatella erecta]|uniref:Beta propeller domain-containing protein n=1 Tax=Stigmatella erecta TaxID=83460 RepID=A0A1I0IJH3_9BACT|nr:beta-propeller domain-containing protein [Stigmatella erecta]SET96365.1 Beta propeller domain-containing protein [Stigmatella erecta]
MTWRWGSVGLALVAVGCGGEGDWERPPNQPVRSEARLESFAGCEELESYIEDTAVLDMRTQLSWQGYWGGGGGGRGPDMGNGAPPPMAPGAGAPEGGEDSAGGGPGSHTGTNNQVAGVDEADFVKNDGTRIFVISGQKLYVHKSWPAASLQALSSLTLEGYPREMFLTDQNQVIVFSGIAVPLEGEGSDSKPGAGAGAPLPSDSMPAPAPGDVSIGLPWYGVNATKVTVVDVTDPTAPHVADELYLPGSYTSARRSNGTVRMLLSEYFRWPEGVRFYPDGNISSEAQFKKELQALMKKNERLIRESTLAQWLPRAWHKAPDGSKAELAYDCQQFFRSNAPTQLGFVTVATLNLEGAGALSLSNTHLLAPPGELYASEDSLYLANNHWWMWPENGQKRYSYLHKFDLRQPGEARYVGSGVVEGSLLNQFSMDEHEGVLRVATTLSTLELNDSTPWGREKLSSRVTTFREQAGLLKEVGRSVDLADEERIYSARFVGPKGYVVTFRQTDPLFTFDLSDPAHPRKVGELKVPGFSTYIHPMGDTHLLTIGQHVPEGPNDPSLPGLKLSLFDVSDMSAPTEAFTLRVASPSAWSDASYDHKAFNFFAEKGLLAIPIVEYSYAPSDYWSGFRSELRVFRVNASTGITPVGTLPMSDLYNANPYNGWTWYWSPAVRRSVMADDYVYAIGDAGVRVAHVDTLQVPLATVLHERATPSP